jgi:acyl carrier protein
MTNNEIYERLTKVFRDLFNDDELTLRPDLSAADVLGWDSLKHVRLILMVEKEFSHKYPASKIAKLENVEELVGLIRSYS